MRAGTSDGGCGPSLNPEAEGMGPGTVLGKCWDLGALWSKLHTVRPRTPHPYGEGDGGIRRSGRKGRPGCDVKPGA